LIAPNDWVYEAEAGAAPLTAAQSWFADVPTKCIDPTCPAGGPKGGKSHFTVLKYI
jgi:rubredoxin